ncbi:MAG: TRAP transporter small permease [Dehalococcoidales bacterium]|nr:TRAP transporter small permease [Dehalococcoidales bacterium]
MVTKVIKKLFFGIRTITDFFTNITEYILLLLLLWVTFSVIMRYIFSAPIIFGTEFAIFLAVYIFYLPLAVALRKGILPVISFIADRLPPRGQNFILALSSACFCAFSVFLAYILVKDMISAFGYGTKVDMMPWMQTAWIRLPMIIGMVLLALVTLSNFGVHVKNFIIGKPPESEPALK